MDPILETPKADRIQEQPCESSVGGSTRLLLIRAGGGGYSRDSHAFGLLTRAAAGGGRYWLDQTRLATIFLPTARERLQSRLRVCFFLGQLPPFENYRAPSALSPGGGFEARLKAGCNTIASGPGQGFNLPILACFFLVQQPSLEKPVSFYACRGGSFFV